MKGKLSHEICQEEMQWLNSNLFQLEELAFSLTERIWGEVLVQALQDQNKNKRVLFCSSSHLGQHSKIQGPVSWFFRSYICNNYLYFLWSCSNYQQKCRYPHFGLTSHPRAADLWIFSSGDIREQAVKILLTLIPKRVTLKNRLSSHFDAICSPILQRFFWWIIFAKEGIFYNFTTRFDIANYRLQPSGLSGTPELPLRGSSPRISPHEVSTSSSAEQVSDREWL